MLIFKRFLNRPKNHKNLSHSVAATFRHKSSIIYQLIRYNSSLNRFGMGNRWGKRNGNEKKNQ